MFKLRDDRGQVLVMTAFCMACLLGALGLAVDVGVLFNARRQMQTAADAAAVAAATEAFYNGSGSSNINQRAYDAAKANGVDHSASGVNVIVTVGSTSTPLTLNPGSVSCASCVKVQLSKPNHTIFMQTMSQFFFNNSSYNQVNVSAMAIAGAPGYSHTCMYVMDPTDPDTLDIHGAGSIKAAGCNVYVNSNNQSALCVTGSAGKTDLSPGGVIEVVGGQDSSGNCKGDPGPPTSFGAGIQSSPYAKTLPSDPTTNCTTGSGGNTIDLSGSGGSLSGKVTGPGYGNYVCYRNGSCTTSTKKGVTTTTCNPVTVSSASLGPGNYIFETGVSISGATTIGTGSGNQTATNGGATVIITNGTYDSGTATTFYDYAPADMNSTYNGLAVYQVATDTNAMTLQFGSGSSVFMGSVYAPAAQVSLHDQGGAVNATQLIVGSIYLNGKVNLENYSSYNQTTTPFRVITLVQ